MAFILTPARITKIFNVLQLINAMRFVKAHPVPMGSMIASYVRTEDDGTVTNLTYDGMNNSILANDGVDCADFFYELNDSLKYDWQLGNFVLDFSRNEGTLISLNEKFNLNLGNMIIAMKNA